MSRLDWLCALGIVVLLALLWWMAVQGWPQDTQDPLAERLDAIEQRLDRLLEAEQREEPPAKAPPKRPPRRRRRVVTTPPAEPVPLELPRLEPTTLPEDPPPRPCCTWTWEQRDRRKEERWLTDGD